MSLTSEGERLSECLDDIERIVRNDDGYTVYSRSSNP